MALIDGVVRHRPAAIVVSEGDGFNRGRLVGEDRVIADSRDVAAAQVDLL